MVMSRTATIFTVCLFSISAFGWAARAQQGGASGQLRSGAPPVYPADAKARGITGLVTLKGIIGKDGHLRDLQALAGPVELRQAAIDAASSWNYFPYTSHGAPVDMETRVNVWFKLSKAEKKAAKAAAQAGLPSQSPSGMSPH